MNHDLSLSASKLNLFRDDPLAFWLSENGILKLPEQIFPSITGGIDRAMKSYLDEFRGQSLPPHLLGEVNGVLYGDVGPLRHWQSGLKGYMTIGETVVRVIGALDDLIVEPSPIKDGLHVFSPLDNKSRGSSPKDDGATYYQTQCDIYALLLEENLFPPSGKAYLTYTWPVQALKRGGLVKQSLLMMDFESQTFTLSTSADRARQLIADAVECLHGPPPDPTPGKLSGFASAYNDWDGTTEPNDKEGT